MAKEARAAATRKGRKAPAKKSARTTRNAAGTKTSGKKAGKKARARKAALPVALPVGPIVARHRARRAAGVPPVADAVAGAGSVIDQITALAARSKIAAHGWKDDGGKAPLAYIKGMALVYARVYCKLKAGDPAVLEMAKAKSAGNNQDVLVFYDPIFVAAGLPNNGSGADILRHLFVLLTGVGVRESSGRYCMGRYMRQNFDTADSAEAGLFQASFDVTPHCKTILTQLFDHYSANPSGFLDTFKAGISCDAQNWRNWGDPGAPGFLFQQLTKTCPAFAAEFAAVGLRNHRSTWGSINNRLVEVVPDCDAMFKDVEALMDSAPGLCAGVL